MLMRGSTGSPFSSTIGRGCSQTLCWEILIKRVGRATPDEAPTIHRYVENVDSAYVSAANAGATVIVEPADQFYGDRLARGADPCGNQLFIASNGKDVDMDGLMKRMVPLR